MYKKLDDWIYMAQKTEMDAVEEMSVVIKRPSSKRLRFKKSCASNLWISR